MFGPDGGPGSAVSGDAGEGRARGDGRMTRAIHPAVRPLFAGASTVQRAAKELLVSGIIQALEDPLAELPLLRQAELVAALFQALGVDEALAGSLGRLDASPRAQGRRDVGDTVA